MNLEYVVNHNQESGKRTKVCRAEAKQAATQRLLERGGRTISIDSNYQDPGGKE